MYRDLLPIFLVSRLVSDSESFSRCAGAVAFGAQVFLANPKPTAAASIDPAAAGTKAPCSSTCVPRLKAVIELAQEAVEEIPWGSRAPGPALRRRR